MKRYLVFKGGVYYPSGGWDDFVGAFDSLDIAKEEAKVNYQYDWSQVIDTETMKEVPDET